MRRPATSPDQQFQRSSPCAVFCGFTVSGGQLTDRFVLSRRSTVGARESPVGSFAGICSDRPLRNRSCPEPTTHAQSAHWPLRSVTANLTPEQREHMPQVCGVAALPPDLGIALAAEAAARVGEHLVEVDVESRIRRMSRFLAQALPGPGYEPARERLEPWRWHMSIRARTSTGREMRVEINAYGHPFYCTTPRMLAEAGLLLSEAGSTPDRSGCLTPSTALGTRSAGRFARAGLRFSLAWAPRHPAQVGFNTRWWSKDSPSASPPPTTNSPAWTSSSGRGPLTWHGESRQADIRALCRGLRPTSRPGPVGTQAAVTTY